MNTHIESSCLVNCNKMPIFRDNLKNYNIRIIIYHYTLCGLRLIDWLLSDTCCHISYILKLFPWNIKQCSDLLSILRSEPNFFWKHQFELIIHEILLKTNRFACLKNKSVRKNIIFFGTSEIEFFLLTWTVTLF